MYKLCASLLALLLLLACRSQPPATELKAYDLADSTPQETPAKVYGSFNATTLYALLAAEIAGQRQLPSLALETYLEQARATLDPGIAERALQIAEYLRDSPSAQEAALIWAKAAPQERAAQRSAAIHLALAGRYIEASEYMERALDNNSERFDFLELGHLGDDPQGRADLLQSLDILLKKYPENTQVILSKAQLLSQSGETEQALQLLSEQHSKKNSHTAVLLHSHLLQKSKRSNEALALLSQALKQSPGDLRLRFARAKLLLEENRLPEARADFIHLLAQSPEDDSLRYMLAQIYLEQQAWQEAIVYLEELIERENHLDAAHFGLGRAFAAQGDIERALTEYAQVEDGDYYLPAQFQSTDILLAQGRAEEAQQRLAGLRENLSEYRLPLYQMEIELLTKHGQYQGAQMIAKQALEEFPGTPELLYARAMLAEKQNDLAQLERDLWSIIERDPSLSAIYGALSSATLAAVWHSMRWAIRW